MVDIERAGRLAGSRSYVLKGDGVLLEQAVLRLGLDLIRRRGFTPLSVPVIVKEWALRGTAYFPGAEEQTYQLANPTVDDEDMWLVGTSEVSVTAFHAGEILDLAELPLKYAGISPCFRREAGTYGKDTRGIYRVHQFNKVEQVDHRRRRRREDPGAPPGDRRATRRPCSRRWSCRIASRRRRPATSAAPRRSSTTSRRGCPRARRTARRTPRAASATTRPGA